MSEEARPEADRASSGAARVCYALAFLSGVAALIYEVTWAKMLALTFGSTTISAAAVVAGFLGGMGAGAALFHRLPGHAAPPLRVYAWIELAIAASAALLSSSFYALPEHFARLSGLVASPALLTALRLGLVLLLLCVPAALMGATFPALCRALIHSAPGVDRRLGWIYGVNTLGAACGALLAGLALTEWLGLRGSSLFANAINVIVAVVAFAFARRLTAAERLTDTAGVTAESTTEERTAIPTALPRAVTGVVLVLSGFCTLGYEILWFRGLRYLVGASTYAFSIVLFTFLCGLGLGSLLLRAAAARRAPERDLVVVQCAIAVLALGGMGLQSLALSEPALYQHLSIFVPRVRRSPWEQRLLLDLMVAIATLLPATVFMGLSFPLATRLYLGDVRRLDARVGAAYLLANVGSIAGAVAGALVLLPYFGTIGGTKLCAGLNLLAAAVIAGGLSGRRRALSAVAAATAACVALALLLPRSLALLGEEFGETKKHQQVFFEEGDLATVKVQRETLDPTRLTMSIDGYKIGWSAGYRGTPLHQKQVLLAHLPLVVDRRIRRTLSIGLGSGATLAELGRDPRLETLDCVEINGAVARGAQLFPEARVLADPRTRLFIEDAVHHLLRSKERYDVIVSDGKQDPFFSGNASLLCREFYLIAHRRLGEQGLLLQWFPLGTLASDLATVITTLCEVFPFVDAFCFPPHSLFVAAGLEPLSARPPLSEREFAALPLRESLAHYGVQNPGALLVHWVAGRERLAKAVANAPVCRWDRQILDVSPFRARPEDWESAIPANLELMIEAEEPPSSNAGPELAPVDRRRLDAQRLMYRAWAALRRGRRAEALVHCERAVAADPDDIAARAMVEKLRGERPAQH